MATLLQVLGLFFLVVVTLLLGIVVMIWWKVRNAFKGLKGTLEGLQNLVPTPARIHLIPLATPSWQDKAKVEELTAPLSGLGFTLAGSYQVEEGGFELQAWVDTAKAITAVVYEHVVAGIWLDLFTHYEDGTRITYVNTAQGSGVDHAPGHTVERFPGLGTEELYQRFVADRPEKPRRTITAETFVPVFEKAYADEMDWRNSRGGPTEQEVRAVAALSGKPYSEEILAMTRQAMEQNALDQLDAALRERFLEESRIPAGEWEKLSDRVVIVHDRLTHEMLESTLEEWTDGEEFPATDGEAGSLRSHFAAFNEGRPQRQRFRKLGEVKQPIEADIYCAPE